jgi:hypothetical protein
MNLMEEMPNAKSPEPMVFSKPVVNASNPAVPTRRYDTTLPALGFFNFDSDWKSFFIIFLLAVVLATYFGINVLTITGNATERVVGILSPAITSFLKMLGYSTGTAINSVADVTADVAKTGVDIAEGTIQNVGNLLIGVEKGPYNKKNNEPRPDAPEDTIQKSLASSKTKWCLVGEYQNKRGCIDISESDKCMSGEVFPNEEMCRMGRPQFQTN